MSRLVAARKLLVALFFLPLSLVAMPIAPMFVAITSRNINAGIYQLHLQTVFSIWGFQTILRELATGEDQTEWYTAKVQPVLEEHQAWLEAEMLA